MFKLFGGIITLVALAWAGLFFGGYAVLVQQSTPTTQAAGLLATTTCTYFDGLGLHDLEQTTSPLAPLNDLTGGHSGVCDRIIATDIIF